MKKKSYYCGKKDRISIRKFLKEYIWISYTKEDLLTHKKLKVIVEQENEKNKKRQKELFYHVSGGVKLSYFENYPIEYYEIPKKVKYNQATLENMKKGKILLVIDEVGKIQSYQNPKYFSMKNLQKQMDEISDVILEDRRIMSLLKEGYVENDEGEYHQISLGESLDEKEEIKEDPEILYYEKQFETATHTSIHREKIKYIKYGKNIRREKND